MSHNQPQLKAIEPNLPPPQVPSNFQLGESCLVTLGGVHMHGDIRAVSFGDDGKVRYTCWIGDSYGIIEVTVPSERCSRGMETMLGYGPSIEPNLR